MATKKQKIKVGVFLIVSLTLMVGSFVVIAGIYAPPGLEYHVEFEESILGLYEGGLVEYLGVPVGKVTNIYVTGDKRANVRFNIDPQKVTLNEGVEAELVIYSLAAGTMAISLSGGKPEGPKLPRGSRIPAKPSIIQAVGAQIEEMLFNMTEVAKAIGDAVSELEEGDLTRIVRQVQDILDEGQEFVRDGRGLIREATGAVEDVRAQADDVIAEVKALSQDVRALARDAQELVRTGSDKLGEFDVIEMQERIAEVMDNVAELTEQMNESVGQLDVVSANVLHEADNIEHSLRRSLREVNDAMDTLRLFVEQLRENPAALIRGAPVD